MAMQPTHRLRLNADVWTHAASFLGDAKSLRTFETASRAHLTISQKTTAWCAALATASSTHLAAAFLKAAPDARALCRAWAQRWRARPNVTAYAPHAQADVYPTLCVPRSQYTGPFTASAPRVVFAFGQSDAGVMEWDGLLATGQKDDDRSLTLIWPRSTTDYQLDGFPEGWIIDRSTTSCWVLDRHGETMIELWRDVVHKDVRGRCTSSLPPSRRWRVSHSSDAPTAWGSRPCHSPLYHAGFYSSWWQTIDGSTRRHRACMLSPGGRCGGGARRSALACCLWSV